MDDYSAFTGRKFRTSGRNPSPYSIVNKLGLGELIMKKVLITGRNSYIGNRLAAWLALWPEEYQVDKVSLQTDKWQDIDWSGYDSIIHVAGIAHN